MPEGKTHHARQPALHADGHRPRDRKRRQRCGWALRRGSSCAMARSSPPASTASPRTTTPPPHAEVVAIREACRVLGDFRLTGCEVYTSCEPCPMCLAALYCRAARRSFMAIRQADAAQAGFDDSFLYVEVASPTANVRFRPRNCSPSRRSSASTPGVNAPRESTTNDDEEKLPPRRKQWREHRPSKWPCWASARSAARSQRCSPRRSFPALNSPTSTTATWNA